MLYCLMYCMMYCMSYIVHCTALVAAHCPVALRACCGAEPRQLSFVCLCLRLCVCVYCC